MAEDKKLEHESAAKAKLKAELHIVKVEPEKEKKEIFTSGDVGFSPDSANVGAKP